MKEHLHFPILISFLIQSLNCWYLVKSKGSSEDKKKKKKLSQASNIHLYNKLFKVVPAMMQI